MTELTKQFPDVLSAWEDLDVSKGEAVGNAYIRLKPGQSISTKTAIEGPIEVELMARAASRRVSNSCWPDNLSSSGRSACWR